MAHDPTRSWPTGKGPDNTSIPGAAWLELLDGQAFPVVGAGVMVRDGNLWTPASSSNPLHVRAQALEQLIGALNATKETNPDAASASMLALLRGLIAIVGKEATLGQILAALGAPAQESTLVDVLAALTTLAGTVDSGAQKVALTGRDVETGKAEPLSVVRDPNGNYVLRVVESAPVAYDKVRDELRTKSSNSRAELIHSVWTGLHTQHSVAYAGINVGTASASITPIDVSAFKDKLVVIKNEYDQGSIAVSVRGHRSLDAGANGSEDTILDEVISSDDGQSVEAGSTLVLDTADWPKMARPYIGFTLRLQRVAPAPTGGRITIDIFGRGI